MNKKDSSLRFIDVDWIHDFEEEPIRLVSEIDSDGYETRKLEIFREGKIGFATSTQSSHDTDLSEKPIPSLKEINESPEFVGKEISKQTFNDLWKNFGPDSTQ